MENFSCCIKWTKVFEQNSKHKTANKFFYCFGTIYFILFFNVFDYIPDCEFNKD